MLKDILILWKIYKRRHPTNLSSTDIVMDIGSGDRPHPRANILLERFVNDSSQRAGAMVVEGWPLVVGDITALPFPDQAIDYIICSHVLEHMESSMHLKQALSELTRVGKRGYIEMPSFVFEKLLGAPYHHWYVRKDGQRIIFRRKTNYGEYEDLMRGFLPLHRDSKTFFRLLFENFDTFFVGLEWTGKIDCQIEGVSVEDERALLNNYPEDLRSGVNKFAGQLLREHRWRVWLKQVLHKLVGGRAVVDIFQFLACPVCKTRVTVSSSRDAVVCCLCSRSYPVRNGVPIMLPEESSLIGPST